VFSVGSSSALFGSKVQITPPAHLEFGEPLPAAPGAATFAIEGRDEDYTIAAGLRPAVPTGSARAGFPPGGDNEDNVHVHCTFPGNREVSSKHPRGVRINRFARRAEFVYLDGNLFGRGRSGEGKGSVFTALRHAVAPMLMIAR